MKDALKYILLAGAGWLAYKTYLDSSAAPAVTTTGGTTGGGSTTTANPTTLQLLKAAAAGNSFLVDGKMNRHQWAYYFATLPGRSALEASVLDAFFINGVPPADDASEPKLTAEQFLAGLATKGISGYRHIRIGR